MRTNIPSDLLRTFIAIVDTGSMVQAAGEVYLTQSAVSLQIRRLETLLGTNLFSRSGRRLVLTPPGQELASIAREILNLNDQAVALIESATARKRIRIGCAQDFADAILNRLFVDIFRSNPELMAEVKVGTTAELTSLLEKGEIDLLAGMGYDEEGECIATVPVQWYGEARLFDRQVLPVALLDNSCGLHTKVINALERHGRDYRVIVETRSISALRAAVHSGMAVTARTGAFLPDMAPVRHSGAPEMATMEYWLRHDPRLPTKSLRIVDMVREILRDLARAA